MKTIKTAVGLRVPLENGGEIEVQPYVSTFIDGLCGELADGASFAWDDGCVVTRRGGQTVWYTPARAADQGQSISLTSVVGRAGYRRY